MPESKKLIFKSRQSSKSKSFILKSQLIKSRPVTIFYQFQAEKVFNNNIIFVDASDENKLYLHVSLIYNAVYIYHF